MEARGGSARAVTGSGVIRGAAADWSVSRTAAFLVAGVTGPAENKVKTEGVFKAAILRIHNIITHGTD